MSCPSSCAARREGKASGLSDVLIPRLVFSRYGLCGPVEVLAGHFYGLHVLTGPGDQAPYDLHRQPRPGTGSVLLFGGLYGRALGEGGQGSAGDAGVVLHLGPHHLGAVREVGEVLLRLLADTAADDDEVGPE